METYDIKKPRIRMWRKYHESPTVTIQEWCGPDHVVEMVNPDDNYPEGLIIKRVDLSTVKLRVPVHGLTNKQIVEAKKEHIFIEIRNLTIATLLGDWYMAEEKSEHGEEKIYVYIGIIQPGVPASKSLLQKKGELDEARDEGIKYFRNHYKLVLHDDYSKDYKYFGFGHLNFALPFMLRDAKLLENK
ncbi:hypothetical protein APHAL10511_001428 [Amanita phalloides]|nr:hypothetical protein APHAL10511_001428 [Amanita phalloides]